MPTDNFFDPQCPACGVRYGDKVYFRHLNACRKKHPDWWEQVTDRASSSAQAALRKRLAAADKRSREATAVADRRRDENEPFNVARRTYAAQVQTPTTN